MHGCRDAIAPRMPLTSTWKDSPASAPPDVLIVTYQLLCTSNARTTHAVDSYFKLPARVLRNLHYDLVVLDEAHPAAMMSFRIAFCR